jgi:hypothetical protein
MKMLKDQRKGEDDNVLTFEKPELATAPKGPGDDWLRRLPINTRFVCRRQEAIRGCFLQWYGVAMIEEKAVLLGTDHEFNPGHIKMTWVDSKMFSQQHTLIQVLPDRMEEEEVKPPEE